MRSMRLISVLLALIVLAGCAVGNEYDYTSANISLPLAGSGDIGVAVVDNRSYVLSGEKEPNFIGLQRGGFANPFDVTTMSGNSLTDDMQLAMQNALQDSGYNVTSLDIDVADVAAISTAVAGGGMARNVVLIVNDWKTDIYMNFGLTFDLMLNVISQDGETLASSEARGDNEKISGAGMPGQNSRTAASAFETKVGRLFNNPDIIGALSN